VNINAGHTAQEIIQKAGFTQISWKVYSGIAVNVDKSKQKPEDRGHSDFTLNIPELLDSIIHIPLTFI